MFESAIIRQNGTLDVGLLAETLLFYKQVIVPAHRGNVVSLLKTIGPDNLLGLIDDGHLTLELIEDNLGVHTKTDPSGAIEFHGIVAFELVGNQQKRKMTSEEKWLGAVQQTISDIRTAKRVTRHLLSKTTKHRINTINGVENEVTRLAHRDILNTNLVSQAVTKVLTHYAPNYLKDNGVNFKVVDCEQGLVVINDIQFDLVNEEAARQFPKDGLVLTPALILSHILTIQEELALSAHYLSELVTSPLNHDLLQIQFDHLLIKRNKNQKEVSSFQDNILEGRSIREAINSGERSFSDFRKLLKRADKFKNWTGELKPDAKLIAEYCASNVSGTWADSLPLKVLRFAVCTCAGYFDSGSGVTAGLADSFLLDKILKGWKPHHFVQGRLRSFVNTDF